jgi:hypothetical protein
MNGLFIAVLKNTVLEDWGQIHRIFCESTPFSGDVGGGGGVLSAFSKTKLRFPGTVSKERVDSLSRLATR